MDRLDLRILGHDLPGLVCGEHRDVHVGTQRGREPEQLVPGDAARAVFDVPVEVVELPDGSLDFRGPYVQGRRGARFVYLTWGERPAGGGFAMFRRAKLFLADVPRALVLAGAARTSLGLTDARGMPLCATVRPEWTAFPVNGVNGVNGVSGAEPRPAP
ncbi:DUF5990 family protein [Streptomyces sp. NPDC001941]|uniref:DUF5990 family protein n=1 Tax=Streptomyces sp. NPDC001941 TaxID=3154659 RepID=UPI00331D1DD7